MKVSNLSSFFLLFAFLALVRSESVIDNFTGNQTLVLVTSAASSDTTFSSVLNSAVLGGERDAILTITESSGTGLVVIANVQNKQLTLANPNGVSATLVIQYDGKDNSSTLNTTGLGGINFLTLSPKQSFSINSQVDVSFTSIEILVTDMNGGQSTAIIDVASSTSLTTFTVPFSEFTGNVDFSDVGAVQLEIASSANIDFIAEHFVLNDNTAPSATRTVTPTPSTFPNISNKYSTFSSTSSSFSSTSISSFFSSLITSISSGSSNSSSSDALSHFGQLSLFTCFVSFVFFILNIVTN